MLRVLLVAQGLAMLSFGWYGVSCFVSERVIEEHGRYGSPSLRIFTGLAQLVASLGLLVGFFSRSILILSAGGLAALMVAAVVVRIRLKDPVAAMLPAFGFLCLNLLIVILSLRNR
jgi:hypothetical protein